DGLAIHVKARVQHPPHPLWHRTERQIAVGAVALGTAVNHLVRDRLRLSGVLRARPVAAILDLALRELARRRRRADDPVKHFLLDDTRAKSVAISRHHRAAALQAIPIAVVAAYGIDSALALVGDLVA